MTEDNRDRDGQVPKAPVGETPPVKKKSSRGFASMSPERQREIARKGGKAAHEKGTAHEFTSDEARAAGRKGGEAVSRDRKHMAEIGREGGQARGLRASERRKAMQEQQQGGGSAVAPSASKPEEDQVRPTNVTRGDFGVTTHGPSHERTPVQETGT